MEIVCNNNCFWNWLDLGSPWMNDTTKLWQIRHEIRPIHVWGFIVLFPSISYVYDLNATNKQVGSPRQRDLCTLESWKGSIQKSRDVVFCMVEPRSPNPRCFPRVVNRMDTPRYGHCNVGQCSVLDGHDGPDGRLLGVGVKNACYSVPVWLGNKNRIVPMDLQNTHKFTHINIAKQWLKAAMEHISHSLICCDEALSFWG